MISCVLPSLFPDAQITIRLRPAPVTRREPEAVAELLAVLEDLAEPAAAAGAAEDDAERLAALRADIQALSA